MLSIPLSSNEMQRLDALRQLYLLDTDFELTYDSIAKLAADVCDAPIAIVSFVDADRHWFKAIVGMDGIREIPRVNDFCSHTHLSDNFFEITDVSSDSRFLRSALITAYPDIKFYAGVPLIDSNQFVLGVLCVLDRKPRTLNDNQRKQLTLLADLIMQITLNRAIRINLMQQALDRELDAVRHYRETPVMMHSVDDKGVLLQVSNHWCKVLDYHRNDVIGRQAIEFLTKASRREAINILLPEFLRTGYCQEAPLQMMKKNGDVIDVLLTASADYDYQGKIIRSWSVMVDVTERNRLAFALESEKERAQVTLHSIGDAVITTDKKCIVDYLNPIAEQMTGWTLAEAQGKPLEDVFRIINETTRKPAVAPVLRCLEDGRVLGLAHYSVLIHRNGQEISIEDTAAPIRTSSGEIIGAVLVFHDVTVQRQLQDKIIFQARHDALTSLVNRSEFDSQLRQLIAEVLVVGDEHALCYLDLDQFKLVNDTCGHAAGDELLSQLSVLLKSKIRKHDTLARLGGDEFGLLLRDCKLDDALRIAQTLLTVVEEFRFCWQDKRFKLGVSIGLVPITAANKSPESILQTADTACYAAKETGRNRIYVLREEDDEVAHRYGEMQWYNRIPLALEENRFILYAQPIIEIQPTGDYPADMLHFEILLRLKDECGKIIPPGAFMPAAERYNLASSIDRWVVVHTLQWLAANKNIVDRLHLCAINLSGQSLSDAKFHLFVLRQLEQTGVPAEKICFEVTETAAIANLANAIDFMKKLGAKGCRFALDDFGNGLSSLGYLKTLPVDVLKIDGLFVRDIADDPVDLALVRSINEVAQLLGKKTVAEYVENNAILEQLRKLGVDYAQGYGVGMPVLLDSLRERETCEFATE
ncbi:MAG: EAL domain-containing protein [Methylococcaceae bacterium]